MTRAPNEKAFADLFNDPTNYNLVLESIEHTIMASFAIDVRVFGTVPNVTGEKVAQRWLICEKWYRVMRGDLGFGLIRTLDTLPRALACELLDQPFDPMIGSEHGWGVHTIKDIVNSLEKS